MPKKKPEKYYTVRVVNPSRSGPSRSIAVPGRSSNNAADCHVCTKSNPLSKAAERLLRRLRRSRDEGVSYYEYRKVPQAAYELEEAGLVRLSPWYGRDTKVELVASNPRRHNPTYRYGAVPVEDAGRETVYVARGKRRDDMLRTVANRVPGDADVDLQRTRTFATKHEATRYAEGQSPRVVQLSRRIRNP